MFNVIILYSIDVIQPEHIAVILFFFKLLFTINVCDRQFHMIIFIILCMFYFLH